MGSQGLTTLCLCFALPLATLGACVSADVSQGDASNAHEDAPVFQTTAWPRTVYGAVRTVRLTGPAPSKAAILENATFEVWVDGEELLRCIERGSAYEGARAKLRIGIDSGDPVRLSLDDVPLQRAVAGFLGPGLAKVVSKANGRSYDEIQIVPWSTQPSPGTHSHGGMEYRLAGGQVILRELIWIE
jgi:hypothetical protein